MRVHGPAGSGVAGPVVAGASHAERRENALLHRLEPRTISLAGNDFPGNCVAHVGVVEACADAVSAPDAGQQFLPGDAVAAFPPRPFGLGVQAAGVVEQRGHRHAAHGVAELGQVVGHRVVEVDESFGDELQHSHGDEGLGQRPDPVRGVGRGECRARSTVEVPDGVRPRDVAVAQQCARDRRRPVFALLLQERGVKSLRDVHRAIQPAAAARARSVGSPHPCVSEVIHQRVIQ